MNFNFNVEGVETKVQERTSRRIEGPTVKIAEVLAVVGSVSKSKQTPGIEFITVAKSEEEGFEPFTLSFPTDRRLNQEEPYKTELKVHGPYNSTVFWVNQNTMNVTNPNSTIQKLLQIADELGVREEFNQGMKELNGKEFDIQEFAKALTNVFSAKKGAFLYGREDSEYLDNESNTLKVFKKTELYSFGAFVKSAGEVLDLQNKLNKQGEKLIRFVASEERPEESGSAGGVEDIEF